MVELAVAAAGRHPISRPLTAELVPSGLWWVNLRSILRPGEWDALRAAVYEEAGHRCEICGDVGRRHPVEAHEVWSWAGQVQRLVRLVALSPGCHFVKHAGRAQLLGRENDVVDQLRTVNGWKPRPEPTSRRPGTTGPAATQRSGSRTCPCWASSSRTTCWPGPRSGPAGQQQRPLPADKKLRRRVQ